MSSKSQSPAATGLRQQFHVQNAASTATAAPTQAAIKNPKTRRATVTIDSGPVSAEDRLRDVPESKWHDLMLARRAMTSVPNIADIGDPAAPVGSSEWCKYAHHGLCIHKRDTQSHVSRLKYGLLEFKDQERWQKLTDGKGRPFISWEDYVQCPEPFGLGMSLAIATAVIAEKDDKRLLADLYQQLDAQDQANQRPAGRPKTETVSNTENDRNNSRPVGTTAAYALRRLRKDRPDIHARVLAGEITAHAGMIEAGFRKKQIRKKLTSLERIRKLLPKLTTAERGDLLRELLLESGPPPDPVAAADLPAAAAESGRAAQ